MKRIVLAFAAALSVTGCAGLTPPPAPTQVAQGTVLDERLAGGLALAVSGAATLVIVASDTGKIKGANADQALILVRKMRALLRAARAAYAASNATAYDAALRDGHETVSQLIALVKGA